jgi:hypothetical protein
MYNMSEFPEWAEEAAIEKLAPSKIATEETYEEVQEGDHVMVLIRECYIRDNLKQTLFGSDAAARIVVSFEIKTDGKVFSISLGTFTKVMDNSEIKIKDFVILPLTKVKGYFTLTVNLFQENELKAAKDTIGQTLTFASHAATSIPVVGSTGSTMVGLAGELINLIAMHAPDKPIIRETSTFMVDRKKYPMLKDVDFLRSGVLEICETGFEKKDGEYYDLEGQKGEPSRILLQIVKPA